MRSSGERAKESWVVGSARQLAMLWYGYQSQLPVGPLLPSFSASHRTCGSPPHSATASGIIDRATGVCDVLPKESTVTASDEQIGSHYRLRSAGSISLFFFGNTDDAMEL